MKFHINTETGNPGKCSAKKDNCPFAKDEEHYTSLEAARNAYENSMSKTETERLIAIAKNIAAKPRPVKNGCDEECWTPVKCPEHGGGMNPFGRSAGDYSHICCDNYGDSSINPRHLWNEHDSNRHYTDPQGWADHEKSCSVCNPQEEDD